MGKVRSRISVATMGRVAVPDRVEGLGQELRKTRVAHGYCARELVAEACPYASVCESCANFVTTPEFTPVLESQLADIEALRADAETRGWESEVARHDRVITSLGGDLARLGGTPPGGRLIGEPCAQYFVVPSPGRSPRAMRSTPQAFSRLAPVNSTADLVERVVLLHGCTHVPPAQTVSTRRSGSSSDRSLARVGACRTATNS
jgi:hypothetical protein